MFSSQIQLCFSAVLLCGHLVNFFLVFFMSVLMWILLVCEKWFTFLILEFLLLLYREKCV